MLPLCSLYVTIFAGTSECRRPQINCFPTAKTFGRNPAGKRCFYYGLPSPLLFDFYPHLFILLHLSVHRLFYIIIHTDIHVEPIVFPHYLFIINHYYFIHYQSLSRD